MTDGTRSAAVGVNHGIVSMGDHAQNVLVTLPDAGLPDVGGTPAPPGTSRLRGKQGAGVFVGREAHLGALTGADDGARVLVGLGGSGKSTIARVFARDRRGRDNPVWWIEARGKEQIEAGLAELAIRLAPIFAGLPVPLAASWARSWLAAHPGWLLVLDDVDGPDDVRDLIDELPGGAFLLTSRQGAGWQGLALVVPVGDMSGQEATRLLELVVGEGSQGGEPDLTGAAQLCERLGWLPLAIEQAGAFIAQNVSTPSAYLELLDSDGTQVLEHGAVGMDSKRTVTRIWRVTFDRLAEVPFAAEMLRVLAWFAPTDIPRALGSSSSNPALRTALNTLVAYHLVTLTKDSISVHPLVQEVARTPSEDDPHRTAEQIENARATATALLISAGVATGPGPDAWPDRRRLFPHIETLAANTRPEQDGEQAALLYGWLGQCKDQQGDYRGAIKYLTRSVESHARLTETAPAAKLRSAIYRLGLASAYRHAGDAERGLQLLEETVAFATDALGATHETTMTARAGLGSAYAENGHHERAVAELRALLELSITEYGESDPHTRLARNNLAGAMTKVGLAEEALEIYESCYADDLASLGQDHPSTLVTGHNVGFALQAVGRLDAAIEQFGEIADRRAEVLGSKHPDTLATLASLAATKVTARDFAGARTLMERILVDQGEVLGPDHPSTRDTREALTGLAALMNSAPEEAPPQRRRAKSWLGVRPWQRR